MRLIGLAVALSLTLVPLAAEAQQTGKVYRIGYVSPAFGLTEPALTFNRGLRDSGLIEGQNILVDRRFMGGREDQYAAKLRTWSAESI
jgi:hypothetical protein